MYTEGHSENFKETTKLQFCYDKHIIKNGFNKLLYKIKVDTLEIYTYKDLVHSVLGQYYN